jgi:hypothetical protein
MIIFLRVLKTNRMSADYFYNICLPFCGLKSLSNSENPSSKPSSGSLFRLSSSLLVTYDNCSERWLRNVKYTAKN